MTHMRVQMKQLDEEIRGVVRDQADTGHDGRQALEEAQQAIEKLFGRIRNIKEKAEHSELMVEKITSDIKQLDNAKKHLTDSIRTLEKLRFLITNLEQLQLVPHHMPLLSLTSSSSHAPPFSLDILTYHIHFITYPSFLTDIIKICPSPSLTSSHAPPSFLTQSHAPPTSPH